MADTFPNERLLEIGAALPGRFGYLFHMRLHAHRAPQAQALFDAALARLGLGDHCLDLGANVGSFTARMAETGATVHAFEPDRAAFEALSKCVEGMDNVKTNQ